MILRCDSIDEFMKMDRYIGTEACLFYIFLKKRRKRELTVHKDIH